jgi:four helix bundle protein
VASIERFEDLIAWQKARELTQAVYHVSRQEPFAKDFGLTGQIQRAAVSTMSNIAEEFERNGSAEFHRFLTIAKASCAETQSLLYVALDIGYINQATFEQLRALSDEAAR